jgi:hypothetical protein
VLTFLNVTYRLSKWVLCPAITRGVAEFSWTQLRRSAQLNGATDITLTFLDYLNSAN